MWWDYTMQWLHWRLLMATCFSLMCGGDRVTVGDKFRAGMVRRIGLSFVYSHPGLGGMIAPILATLSCLSHTWGSLPFPVI